MRKYSGLNRSMLAFYFLLFFAPVVAVADVVLDPSFATNGWVTTDFEGYRFVVARDTALQADGKIVATGIGALEFNYDYFVVRYNPDGSLDTSFGTDGIVSDTWNNFGDFAEAVSIQPDGKIVIAGHYFTGGNEAWGLARYNTDGSPDPSFGTDGQVTTTFGFTNYITDLELQPDGKIVVTGYSFPQFSARESYVARYNSDGSLDSSFGNNGIVSTSVPGASFTRSYALGIDPGGKIVSAGFANTSSQFISLIRYNPDGSLDTSFGTDGIAFDDSGPSGTWSQSLAFQTDGKIVVAGDRNQNDFEVVRFNTDGSPDASFGTDGFVVSDFGGQDQAKDVVIQSDGKILVAGCGGTGGCTSSNSDLVVARYTSDGSLDSTFGTDGAVFSDFGFTRAQGRSITLQPDARIVVAGSYDSGEPDYIGGFLVARFLEGLIFGDRFEAGGD